MKNTSSTKWGLILALVVAISLLHFGCVTEKKVNSYLANNPKVKDSIKASILEANPCPPPSFGFTSQPAIDTPGLTAYLLGTGLVYNNPLYTYKENDFIPNDNSITQTSPPIKIDIGRVIDSLRKHLPPDTFHTPPDPRAITALNIHLSQARDSIANLKTQIAVLNKGLTDMELNDAATLKQVQHKLDIRNYILYGLVAILVIFGLWKIFKAFYGGGIVNTGDELIRKI